jgi:AcrR family transcriptional regulator
VGLGLDGIGGLAGGAAAAGFGRSLGAGEPQGEQHGDGGEASGPPERHVERVRQRAWQELVEAGFARLTMESVAARARTGVAVLYRRWPNKDDLVIAAIRHYGTAYPVDAPDTGSLRGDMIALLSSFSSMRVSFAATVSAVFSGLMAGVGLTPAQVREKVLADRPVPSEQIFARAHERGEIDLDRIPPAVLTMPFDLIRHDMLMTYKPIPPERVLAIVDDLFMPLVSTSYGAARAPAG